MTKEKKKVTLQIHQTPQVSGDSLLNLTFPSNFSGCLPPAPTLFFISRQKIWTSREGDKCFKLQGSTGIKTD